MMEKMLRLVETTLSNDKFNILHTVFSFITFMKSRIWLMKVVFSLNFDTSLCFRTSYLNCKIRFPRPDSQIIQVWMKNIYTFQTQSSFKNKFRGFVLNKRKERDLIWFFCLHCFLENLFSKMQRQQDCILLKNPDMCSVSMGTTVISLTKLSVQTSSKYPHL